MHRDQYYGKMCKMMVSLNFLERTNLTLFSEGKQIFLPILKF